MNARDTGSTLLAELRKAGVRPSLEGNTLTYRLDSDTRLTIGTKRLIQANLEALKAALKHERSRGAR